MTENTYILAYMYLLCVNMYTHIVYTYMYHIYLCILVHANICILCLLYQSSISMCLLYWAMLTW